MLIQRVVNRHHPELKQTNQIAEKPVDDHLRCVLKKNPKMQIRIQTQISEYKNVNIVIRLKK